VLSQLIRLYVRSKAPGSTRCTVALARRIPALQSVPITINGNQQLYVDLRDGLSQLLLAGSPWESVPWEVDEQTVMRSIVRRGDVVFDVGAHIGLHTVLLSALAGPTGVVHAFEANPEKLRPLLATASRLSNATVHAVGLGDRSGPATLFIPEDQSMASLEDWTEGRAGRVHEATCTLRRIDEMVDTGELPRPDFIKCDVEGGELGVFAGAARVLNRADAPIILYEANARSAAAFGSPISGATDLLRSLEKPRYSIFHLLGTRLRPLESFTDDCDHYNLVAVPTARTWHLRELQGGDSPGDSPSLERDVAER
jgi:FkbM family methyltransferase